MNEAMDELKRRVQRIANCQVKSFLPVSGGYTPTARWLVDSDKGRFFIKVATTPLTAVLLRREACAYELVQGPFIPELIGWEDHALEPLLLIEDLSDAFWPPPWDEQLIERVLGQIEKIHSSSAALPTFAEKHGARGHNWTRIAADPEAFLCLGLAAASWLDEALPILIEAEHSCLTAGQVVTHWDIRSDNLCLTSQGVKFVDWAEACLSNPKLDLGFWLPSLAAEGGPDPETILPHEPGVAAWVAGFFAARAGLPLIPDAPRVRLVQRQQLGTALAWVVWALDLPEPIGKN